MVRRDYGLNLSLALLLVATSGLQVFAQSASVQGIVTDARGRVVVDAKVTIELEDSGRKLEARTNGKGEYLQVGLVQGQYSITVEKRGLGKVHKSVMVLRGVRNRYDVVLAPGEE